MKQHAEAVGLILPDGRAFARSCVVLPLKDRAGAVVSLYGRSIRRGPARHFYLRHRQGLYPGYPSGETRRLILTEALLDAASLLQADLPGFAVLSLFGTGGWTEEHAAALEHLPSWEEVVLFFDGDEAGRAAAEALAGVLRSLCPGALLSQVKTPDGEDVNSLLCRGGVEALGKLIEARTLVHRPSSSPETPASEAARVLEVCVSGCTTRERLFEDNATRCLLLHLDQTKQQNAAVLRYQQRLSAGTIDRSEQARLRALLQNVQRLLKPLSMRNPYAERLSLPPSVFTQRRSNQLYLDLIETVTFYHQHQRRLKTDEATGEVYIETSIADIEAANALIVPVLTSKSDELTDACRLFFEQLKRWLAAQQRQSFYASEIRQVLRLSPTSLKRYLGQLRALGYVELLGGSRYRKGYEYGLTALGRLDSPRAEVVRFLAGVLVGLKRSESAV